MDVNLKVIVSIRKTVRNLSNCFYFIILLPKTNIKANKAININL